MLPRLALGRNLRREEGTHGGECEGAHCSSAGAGVYRSPLKTGGGTLAAAVPPSVRQSPPHCLANILLPGRNTFDKVH